VLNETDLHESLVLTVGASSVVNVQFSSAPQPKVSCIIASHCEKTAAFAWRRETYQRWLSTGHVSPTRDTGNYTALLRSHDISHVTVKVIVVGKRCQCSIQCMGWYGIL